MIVEYIVHSDMPNYTKPAFNSLKTIRNDSFLSRFLRRFSSLILVITVPTTHPIQPRSLALGENAFAFPLKLFSRGIGVPSLKQNRRQTLQKPTTVGSGNGEFFNVTCCDFVLYSYVKLADAAASRPRL